MTLFRGPAAPENKIHDFHTPIAPNGLYWVAVIPDGALKVSPDGRRAELELHDLPVIDQPKWPAHDAEVTPARLTYRVVWTATDEKVDLRDPIKQFAVQGFRATAQLEATVEVPSIGFRWKSDALATSSAAFGVIGEERNGRYFTP